MSVLPWSPIYNTFSAYLTVGMVVNIARGTNHDGGTVTVTKDNVASLTYGMKTYGWHVTTMGFDYRTGDDEILTVLTED